MAEKKKDFDQSRYIQKYISENVYRLQIPLNRKYDSDIIGKLNTVKSKSGYVKELIREDIKKERGKTK